MNRLRRASEPILPYENRKKANSVNIDLSPLVQEQQKKDKKGRRFSVKEIVGIHDTVPEIDIRKFKVVMIGSAGAGKTSFIRRVTSGDFDTIASSTIGVDYSVLELETEEFSFKMHLQLWDTAGQERFHAITKQYFRNADGVMIFYDCTERASFEEASRWADLVSENRGDSIAVVIVCNKTDIPQMIPDEEGILLADRLNATFSKHSSKLGIGTEGLLKGLARKLGQLTPKGEMTTIDLDLPEPNKTKRCC